MGKSLLLSINIEENNFKKYATAVEMAKAKGLALVLFIVLPEKSSEVDMDKAYLHLLQLQGYYQTYFNCWGSGPDIEVKRVVMKGDANEQLRLFLQDPQINTVLF